jgi:hypothetical protein
MDKIISTHRNTTGEREMSFKVGNHEIGVLADLSSWDFISSRIDDDIYGTSREFQFGPCLVFWFIRVPA